MERKDEKWWKSPGSKLCMFLSGSLNSFRIVANTFDEAKITNRPHGSWEFFQPSSFPSLRFLQLRELLLSLFFPGWNKTLKLYSDQVYLHSLQSLFHSKFFVDQPKKLSKGLRPKKITWSSFCCSKQARCTQRGVFFSSARPPFPPPSPSSSPPTPSPSPSPCPESLFGRLPLPVLSCKVSWKYDIPQWSSWANAKHTWKSLPFLPDQSRRFHPEDHFDTRVNKKQTRADLVVEFKRPVEFLFNCKRSKLYWTDFHNFWLPDPFMDIEKAIKSSVGTTWQYCQARQHHPKCWCNNSMIGTNHAGQCSVC